MANKDFKIKNGLDMQSPLPVAMGGTGQTSTSNTLNSLLPSQAGNANKVLSTDGTNTSFITLPVAYQRGGTASRPASPTAGDLYYNTDYNYFESYTANGWFPIAAAPGIPTGVTATNQPSGRAFNNGQMSVAFTPASSGGAPTSFVLTPSPTTSPATFTITSSPVTVTGLSSSTQYTYTVVSTSPYGTSAASSASTGVTATTVPAAPSLSAVGAGQSATITITAGATGGSAITSYSIVSSPSTTTQTATSSPYTFTGLTDGTAYTFTATSTNANGTSSASSASNSVTPSSIYVVGAYDALATVVAPSGGLSSVTFAGIPTGYKHLEIRGLVRNTGYDGGGARQNLYVRFNQDSGANYNNHGLIGNGSSASSYFDTANTAIIPSYGMIPMTDATALIFGAHVINVLDYASSSKFKTLRFLGGVDTNDSTNEYSNLGSGAWRNTNAITSVTLLPQAGAFAEFSSYALYGVK